MPGMNGYDAARLIRQQPGNEKVVLIALTGWGQSTDKNRASLAGFDHHLVKPVDYDRLMSCLAD
jgi:CheY-like chemotaxis protein